MRSIAMFLAVCEVEVSARDRALAGLSGGKQYLMPSESFYWAQ